ncbi:MAG: hypothetical protein IPL01_24605 [Acidobacteria bacterium]|nr:hypothetical protein [Acidobacteriota bacterium]
MVREKFPDVDQVSTAELAGLLSKPEAAKPLLLDARSAKEYAVSHLPNALLAENESQALEALKDIRWITLLSSTARSATDLHNLLRN